MSLLTDLVQRCRDVFRGGREDAETQEELQFHLEMQTEKNLRAGMDPRQARRQAHVRLGGVDAIREAVRDARGARPLDDLFRDLGYALRGARRHHGFTLVAVLTLTLGIGANTAVFTVVDNFLFRPPPFEHVERLVSIRDVNPAQGWMAEDNVPASPGNFLDWREQGRSFDHLVAWRNWFYSVAGPEDRNPIPEQIRGVRISPSFFAMLGVQAAHGRTFLPEEEAPGRDRVVILSDGLWRRRYGGDPTIVGETLLMDGRPFTVVGVLPRDFHFLQTDFDLWMPFAVDEDFRGRDEHSISVWGRLAPGVSLEAAQTELDTITRRLETAYPDTNEGWGTALVPIYPPSYGGAIERALLLLLGAVGCVLLIACANVANLLLVRAGARRRELALRAALGASRGRLVRQLLVESGLLAVLGGAGGLVLAAVGVRLLAPLLPVIGTYTHPSLHIDLRVLGFMVVAVLVTTVLFGLWPAVRTSRTETLRVAGSSGQWSAGRALLVVELALSVMLLAGAALLIQSLWNLQRVDPGFRTDRLLTMQVWLPERKYPSPSGVRTFSDEMLRRVEALPGVRRASTVNTRPFLGWFLGLDVEVPGYVPPETIEGGDLLTYRVVSNLYFETLGAELVQGRAFSTGDGPDGAAVAVVNEAAAARYWPDVEPIGRQFRPRFQPGAAPWIPAGRSDWFTVVGVVGDFRENRIDEPVVPTVYLSQRQNPSRLMSLVVGTRGAATGVARAIQREIRAVDGDLGVYDLRTMDAILSDAVALPRLNALLLWLFAGLALVLSAIGVHGVTSYLVARRTREFAIRIAVGARPADIFRTVTRETALVGAAGILLGLAGSVLLMRAVATVVYEVAPGDATILLGASGAVLGVALAACCRPAWTAMRADPIRVLHAE